MDHSLLQQMESATLAAAARILQIIDSNLPLEVHRKADQSLVTNLDLESHKVCLDRLGKVLPLISEEDPTTHKILGTSDRYFVVDPLDGTTACRRYPRLRGGQVGFGPMIGLVESGLLQAVAFYHIPQRMLFSAVLNQGSFSVELLSPGDANPPALEQRKRLRLSVTPPLSESAVLFYAGTKGEATIIEKLRSRNLIENAFRFGGFANDCSRLAQGFEQASVQFSVKAWDFPATLLATEAGLSVLVDPLGQRSSLGNWKIQPENPVIIGYSDHLREIAKLAPWG